MHPKEKEKFEQKSNNVLVSPGSNFVLSRQFFERCRCLRPLKLKKKTALGNRTWDFSFLAKMKTLFGNTRKLKNLLFARGVRQI